MWTGADAAANGLVDQLGGLEAAMALARRQAALPDTAPVRVYPRSTPLDRLRRPESSEDYAAAGASLLAESWGPVWRLAAGAGFPPFGPPAAPSHPLDIPVTERLAPGAAGIQLAGRRPPGTGSPGWVRRWPHSPPGSRSS